MDIMYSSFLIFIFLEELATLNRFQVCSSLIVLRNNLPKQLYCRQLQLIIFEVSFGLFLKLPWYNILKANTIHREMDPFNILEIWAKTHHSFLITLLSLPFPQLKQCYLRLNTYTPRIA